MAGAIFTADFHTENDALKIRPFHSDDYGAMRYLFDEPLPRGTTKVMGQMIAGHRQKKDRLILAVEKKDGKEIIGFVEAGDFTALATTVGFRIRKEYRGLRYGTAAVELLCQALADSGFKEIKACVRDTNTASKRLLAACGFTKTGSRDGFIRFVRRY